jgi:hypothetical protein
LLFARAVIVEPGDGFTDGARRIETLRIDSPSPAFVEHELYVPVGTSARIVHRLAAPRQAAIQNSKVVGRFADLGSGVASTVVL